MHIVGLLLNFNMLCVFNFVFGGQICYSAYFFCLAHCLLIIIMVECGSECTQDLISWIKRNVWLKKISSMNQHARSHFPLCPPKLSISSSSTTTRFNALLASQESKVTQHYYNMAELT